MCVARWHVWHSHHKSNCQGTWWGVATATSAAQQCRPHRWCRLHHSHYHRHSHCHLLQVSPRTLLTVIACHWEVGDHILQIYLCFGELLYLVLNTFVRKICWPEGTEAKFSHCKTYKIVSALWILLLIVKVNKYQFMLLVGVLSSSFLLPCRRRLMRLKRELAVVQYIAEPPATGN